MVAIEGAIDYYKQGLRIVIISIFSNFINRHRKASSFCIISRAAMKGLENMRMLSGGSSTSSISLQSMQIHCMGLPFQTSS